MVCLVKTFKVDRVVSLYLGFYIIIVTVVPGRAGGGSFSGGRTPKPKKEFAYRMHARRPASAIPKPNFGVLRRSVLWCFGGG